MVSRLHGLLQKHRAATAKKHLNKNVTNSFKEGLWSSPFLCRCACSSASSCSPPSEPAASVFARAAASSLSAAHPAAERSPAAAEWAGERVGAESYWPDVERVADSILSQWLCASAWPPVWLQLLRSRQRQLKLRFGAFYSWNQPLKNLIFIQIKTYLSQDNSMFSFDSQQFKHAHLNL